MKLCAALAALILRKKYYNETQIRKVEQLNSRFWVKNQVNNKNIVYLE